MNEPYGVEAAATSFAEAGEHTCYSRLIIVPSALNSKKIPACGVS